MEKKDDDELLQNLERQTNWDGLQLVKYRGFWCPEICLRPIISCQRNYKARNSDIIISSMMKSGTTWLKALVFSIINRKIYPIDQSPLLATNPHMLVHGLEFVTYANEENPDLQNIPSPRIFSTHVSYSLLPISMHESDCKIVYICRNFLDQFVSYHQFSLHNNFGKDAEKLPLEEAFELFCQGIQQFGPVWDQMLEYWNAHLKYPGKVLFLKYEDLKRDVSFHVRQIAEFIGLPFLPEEERQGMVEEISRLCSFENLSNLEVNKTGSIPELKFNSFFRKGEVGDWTNYLTPEMVERLEKLMESKLEGSGLTFNAYNKLLAI